MTTAQLQGGQASGLGSAFAGGTNGLYPYLVSFYPTGVQAVSGFATTATGAPLTPGAAGTNTVSVLVNGESFGSSATGANGYYYVVSPGTGTITNGASVLAYPSANGTGAANGASLATATGAANTPNVDVFGNTVTVATGATSLTGYLGANTLAHAQTAVQTAAYNADGMNAAAAAAIGGAKGLGLVTSGVSFTLDATGTQTVDLTIPLYV